MSRSLLAALLSLLPCLSMAAANDQSATASAALTFSIIKTAEASTLDGLTYSGGSLFASKSLNHVAILVRHPEGTFLFDTGLGREIDQQYAADMPWWATPFFAYDALAPAADQLIAANVAAPERIILSHSHWDHASAIVDFPNAKVWVSSDEKDYLSQAQPPAVLPSQVNSPEIAWHTYTFSEQPYVNYDKSLDLFGDGSAVMVPLPGHTPGSNGLFLNMTSGDRYFFVGDVVWNADALDHVSPKPLVASVIVDNEREQTLAAVAKVALTRELITGLIVVPAHDQNVHDTMGYFPNWVE